jgi:hypothetical protein
LLKAHKKQCNLNKRYALPDVIVAGIIVNKIEEQFGAAHSTEVSPVSRLAGLKVSGSFDFIKFHIL